MLFRCISMCLARRQGMFCSEGQGPRGLWGVTPASRTSGFCKCAENRLASRVSARRLFPSTLSAGTVLPQRAAGVLL